MTEGLIVKALSGFYYLRTADGMLTCRGRGALRNEEISPMVGDRVLAQEDGQGCGSVVQVLPRRNSLVRPPVSNIDRLVMVVSCTQPPPNPLIIDKLTAIASHRDIPVEVVFSKIDLAQSQQFAAIYRGAGYPVFELNSLTGEGIEPLRARLRQGLSVFCGNSGAGKSSLLNALFPGLGLATAQISRKLGRGKHTTRHIELFDTGDGGFIADTPGFSAVDFLQWERMPARELEDCFPELEGLPAHCRYTGCSHTAEQDCAVRQAVEEGRIQQSRYNSYCAIYAELKSVKEWEL